jgi:bifunctional DNA-binding transcriptional regulator/antitoxin component of YhaV-PrlF toxin-antitoxin module
MMTKLTVMVVPDKGSYYLTIPEAAAKSLGWKEGDPLEIDIPTSYPDQLIVSKKDV